MAVDSTAEPPKLDEVTYIHSLKEFKAFVADYPKGRDKNDGYDLTLYRGERTKWDLLPSIARNGSDAERESAEGRGKKRRSWPT